MMSRNTGKEIELVKNHISQSIQDILTTPIGTRVMRREYGSLLFQLIDGPFDDILEMQIYAATVSALLRWEPRINLHSISLNSSDHGSYVLDLNATLVDNNIPTSLRIPLIFGAAA